MYEPLSTYMYFIQSFKDFHRPGVYDDKICNIITAIFLFLTRSTTPFIERGRLCDFTESVVSSDNAILTCKEKQFLLDHCYYNEIYENHYELRRTG